MVFKPLLAATCEDMSALKFPLLASPKLDGIRAMVIDGKLVSRTMKLIPNKFLQERFGRPVWEGFDGELIDGCPTDADAFNRTTRAVMRAEGEPRDVRFHAFDCIPVKGVSDHEGFVARLDDVLIRIRAASIDGVIPVPHRKINALFELQAFESQMVARGFEGIILRDPQGPYKQGRSTVREQVLMKVKRFTDDEAVVIECVEGEHNANVATKDAFGRTERSSHKAGMVPNGMLGALRVRNSAGQEFNIGTGFTEQDRKGIWRERHAHIGKLAKYRYQAAGMKDVPRFPSFVGFRED